MKKILSQLLSLLLVLSMAGALLPTALAAPNGEHAVAPTAPPDDQSQGVAEIRETYRCIKELTENYPNQIKLENLKKKYVPKALSQLRTDLALFAMTIQQIDQNATGTSADWTQEELEALPTEEVVAMILPLLEKLSGGEFGELDTFSLYRCKFIRTESQRLYGKFTGKPYASTAASLFSAEGAALQYGPIVTSALVGALVGAGFTWIAMKKAKKSEEA